ncbi:MAG: hypothetical protein UV17_C0017G0003 [Candidatus Gottesmanbacteria bacterium GW2011_GWA1_42_26]|nr:MAG: hypothetical protein UV17_C0017G0003 [Candidatus Gottesmanbacteria bacterium GW2011_GWA1_42_26]
MIVIGVVGIVSVIGYEGYLNTQKTARDGKRKADLETIAQALENYRADFGQYPGRDVWVKCDSSVGGYILCTDRCQAKPITCTPPIGSDWSYTQVPGAPSDLNQGLVVNNKYLVKLPVDPVNNTQKFYYYLPNCAGTLTRCNKSTTCLNAVCCAYELGTYLESTNTWYSICNP